MYAQKDNSHVLGDLDQARKYMSRVGDALMTEYPEGKLEALALLFIIRELVLGALLADESSGKDDAIDEVISSCFDEIGFFSQMVHDLLTHDEDRAVYEIASYYTSLIGGLISCYEDQQGSGTFFVRPLRTDHVGPRAQEYESDKKMRDEIIHIQVTLKRFQRYLQSDNQLDFEERSEVALELCRIHGSLSDIFRQVGYRLMYNSGASEFADALQRNLSYLDSIVPSLLESNDITGDVIQMMKRLMDFSFRLAEFIDTPDMRLLKGPFVAGDAG